MSLLHVDRIYWTQHLLHFYFVISTVDIEQGDNVKKEIKWIPQNTGESYQVFTKNGRLTRLVNSEVG